MTFEEKRVKALNQLRVRHRTSSELRIKCSDIMMNAQTSLGQFCNFIFRNIYFKEFSFNISRMWISKSADTDPVDTGVLL